MTSTFTRRHVLGYSTMAVAAGAIAWGGRGMWLNHEQREAAPKDLAGNPVIMAAEEVPTSDELPLMKIEPTTGFLHVPAVNLTAPIDEMTAIGGVIKPPTLTRAYLLRGYATPVYPHDGTVYVAMHSVRYGEAPGNALIDMDSQSPKIGQGASIFVSGTQYSVTSAQVVPKTELATAPGVWEPTRGRLVLITCLQRAAGKSLRNVVIEAMLAN